MGLEEVAAPLGPPWARPLRGQFDQLVVESSILRENPLGDPFRRPLYVYRSPGVGEGAPVVYMLQGYSGQLDTWLGRKAFDPNVVERLDAMFTAGDCPPATVVFLDAWTSIGGSQFLNSPATGQYMDYICDEVVPFVAARHATGLCGVCGHSSGGYGAMVLAMLRPEVFSALASLAGDALFEACYLPEFPRVARTLRDHFEGSFEVMLAQLPESDPFDFGRFGAPLNCYAMAAAYAEGRIPFSLDTGQLVPSVWEQWLEWDPVRMAPRHGDALRAMRRVWLDAGRGDEFFLDLGAQAFAAELASLGVEHTLELFDGGHGAAGPRYPHAVRELVLALAA